MHAVAPARLQRRRMLVAVAIGQLEQPIANQLMHLYLLRLGFDVRFIGFR
jgi:hypothetical protein